MWLKDSWKNIDQYKFLADQNFQYKSNTCNRVENKKSQ